MQENFKKTIMEILDKSCISNKAGQRIIPDSHIFIKAINDLLMETIQKERISTAEILKEKWDVKQNLKKAVDEYIRNNKQ